MYQVQTFLRKTTCPKVSKKKSHVDVNNVDQTRFVIRAVSATTTASKPPGASTPRDAALAPVGVVLVSELVVVAAELPVLHKSPDQPTDR